MPIEGRFKDYIAMPKSNRYQSLHTTVMGYDGKIIEIQIRTEGMHQTAENGIAAHWLYKSGALKEAEKTKELSLINKLKELQGRGPVSSDFLDEIKKELLRDSIYVFTPKGDVVELPHGSTAIDFAYSIHTDIGDHCTTAKADGVIIPLKEPLKNTQVVEVMTSKTAHPHLDWLRYVKTSKARNKVKHWLAQNEPGLIFDRNIVARKKEEAPAPVVLQKPKEEGEPETQIRDPSRVSIRIGQERNIMIRLAQCCTPSTGDAHRGLHLPRPRHHGAQDRLSQHRLHQGFRGAQHRRGVGDGVAQVHAALPGDGPAHLQSLLRDRRRAQEVRRPPHRGQAGGERAGDASGFLHRGAGQSGGLRPGDQEPADHPRRSFPSRQADRHRRRLHFSVMITAPVQDAGGGVVMLSLQRFMNMPAHVSRGISSSTR